MSPTFVYPLHAAESTAYIGSTTTITDETLCSYTITATQLQTVPYNVLFLSL